MDWTHDISALALRCFAIFALMRLSKLVLPFILFAYLVIGLTRPDFGQGKRNFLNHDAYSYYLYLPATLIYGTPFHFDFVKTHFQQYHISSSVYQYQTNDGRDVPFFTMGVALCQLPFFIAAHLLNIAVLGYPADGLSMPYQVGVFLSGLFYFGLGLWNLRRLLRKYFGEGVTATVLLALAFGTTLLQYTAIEPGQSHVYLFGWYGVLLWLTERWHQQPTARRAMAIGAVLALLCLIRPSELLAVLLPLLYGIRDRASFLQKINLLRQHWRQLAALAIVAILVVLPQMLWWKHATGHWIYSAYAVRGDHFDFSKPQLLAGLIGYRKGWLVYTPLVALALFGFLALWRRQRAWFWSALVFISVNYYVLMCYHMWWFATCLGNRALVQSLAVLSLPLAAAVAALGNGATWRKVVLGLFLAGCVALNLFQHWQYQVGLLPFDDINKAYYWRVFGETKPDRTLRKYLDLDTYLPAADQYKRIPLRQFAVADTAGQEGQYQQIGGRWGQIVAGKAEFSRGAKIAVTAANRDSLAGRWLWVQADLFSSGDRFEQYKQARLVFVAERAGRPALEWFGVNFQSYYPARQWNTVAFEVPVPDSLQAGDQLAAYVWSQSRDTIWVNGVGLWRVEAK